jgi:hypothetical protein
MNKTKRKPKHKPQEPVNNYSLQPPRIDLMNTHWISANLIHAGVKMFPQLITKNMGDLIHQNYNYLLFTMYDDTGFHVRLLLNNHTDELHILANDYAKYIGYQSLDDMLINNEVMDTCIIIKDLTGIFPIQQIEVNVF